MTSKRVQDRVPYGRLIHIGGAVAASAGGLALLGWSLGLPVLASLGAGKIPMAPSTAMLFVLYGVTLVLRVRAPRHRGGHRLGVAVYCSGALVALLLLVLSYQRIYLQAEALGFRTVGVVDGAPIGHMSPATALGFLVASLSFLASRPTVLHRRWRAVMAWCFACLLPAAGATALVAYLYGAPLLYGSSFIPPAATTCLAFVALGIALLALADPPAWLRGEPVGAASRPAALLFSAFALLTVGIITAGYVSFRSYEAKFRVEVERQLSSVADLKVSELVQFRRERFGEGSILLGNGVFAALVQRVFDDPGDSQARPQLRDWLNKYRTRGQYDRVSLLDAQGATRMAIPESAVSIELHLGAARGRSPAVGRDGPSGFLPG